MLFRDAFKKNVTNVTLGLTPPPYCNKKYKVFFFLKLDHYWGSKWSKMDFKHNF